MSIYTTTIIFYQWDLELAEQLAVEERERSGNIAMLRDSAVFKGEEEPCDQVWLMPSVSDGHRRRLRETYGDKIVELKDEHMPGNRKPKAPQPPAAEAKAPKPAAAPGDVLRLLTNKQLRALAVERGVDVARSNSRDQLIAALSSVEAPATGAT